MAIHLSKGTRLKDYTLTTDMTSTDAGTSMWAFAAKDNFDYFIKCYLTPVYPDPHGPGSDRAKQRKWERCRAFENNIGRIESTLDACGEDAFLVRCVDFFRDNGTYFKVTKKIYQQKTEFEALPPQKLILVLLSAAYALRSLHQQSSFIHADIKPENFIIQRAGSGWVANLIDFDAGFFLGHPPPADELLGDQRYWAPELIAWLTHDIRRTVKRRPTLLQSLDIFALGLTFCEYLCGALPTFANRYHYPGEALLDGARLTLPKSVCSGLQPLLPLIQSMLQTNPLERPTAVQVHEALRDFNQRYYVFDSTYQRIADSVKHRLHSEGRALVNLATTHVPKTDSDTSSDLKLRGLKSGRTSKIRLAHLFKL